MENAGVTRKLAVIFAADVAGYSRLMAADEEGTLATLNAYRLVIDALIGRHHGRIFTTAGDSVMAEFASAVEAVRCAAAIQQEIERNGVNAELAEPRRMLFRVGVNLGDVMVGGDNLFGEGVNVAARLEAVAEPGGICISGAVHDQIRNKVDLGFDDLGERSLKNIGDPVRVFGLRRNGRGRGRDLVPGADRDAFHDRTSAFPSIAVLPFANFGRRSGAGVLRRRHHRGPDHRAVPLPGDPRDRAQLGHRLQEPAGARSGGRAGSRRPLRPRGQRAQGGRSGAGSRRS